MYLKYFLRKSQYPIYLQVGFCQTWIDLCHISYQHSVGKVSHSISTLETKNGCKINQQYCKFSYSYFIFHLSPIQIIQNHQNDNNHQWTFFISIIIYGTLTCCGLRLFGLPVFCWLNRITAYSKRERIKTKMVSPKTDGIAKDIKFKCSIMAMTIKTVPYQQELQKQREYRKASKPRLQSVLPLLECWLSPFCYLLVAT